MLNTVEYLFKPQLARQKVGKTRQEVRQGKAGQGYAVQGKN